MKYLLLFLITIPALAETITCPPEIKSEQKILDVPKGWKQEEERLNARQTLTGIAFYDGPVDEGATLAPTSEGTKSVWTFEDKKRTHFLACNYRMTYMMVVKELKKVERCEVEYPEKSTIPTSINCK
jgi:hypothetical protein